MTRPPRHGIVPIMQSDASTAPVLTRAARETAYLTIGLLTSSLALTVWVVGVSLSLIVFVVGLAFLRAGS